MRSLLLVVAAAAAAATAAAAVVAPVGGGQNDDGMHKPKKKPPHICFVLADDWGQFNAGYRGDTDSRTPAVDKLAAEGLVLERFYVHKWCAPTRCARICRTVIDAIDALPLPLSLWTWPDATIDGSSTATCKQFC